MVPMGTEFEGTPDEQMNREIEEEYNEAEKELSEPLVSTEDEQPQEAEGVLADVVQEAEQDLDKEEPEVGETGDASTVNSDETNAGETDFSSIVEDENQISNELDDVSDKAEEESEDIEFSSPAQSIKTEDMMTEKSLTEPEDISSLQEEEDQEEDQEIVEFGDSENEGESEEEETETNEEDENVEGQNEEGEVESENAEGEETEGEEAEGEEGEETAAEKTRDELENQSESAEEFRDEIAEGLGEEKPDFESVFNNAMEKAIKLDPKATSVVVVGYNKDEKTSDIKNIKIENFRSGTFRSPNLDENKDPKDLLTDTQKPIPEETDKSPQETQNLLDEKIKELEEQEILGYLQDEKEKLNHPKGKPDLTAPFSGSSEFQDFDHTSFEEELVKQQEEIANAMKESENGNENPHNQYLKNQQQAKEALKLFAESDAFRRASQELPPGVPDQVFLSDLMGVSGVGSYEPSSNMLHYYGALSGFQGHFANKARSTISFEDIDTLTGLLSDINGVFTTIFNLLPSKKEAEEENNSAQKSNFEKAYDILKFYSRVRGFVHALVYNRHLIVQDIQFLKDKVENLNSTQEDMLRFYGIEVEYARMVVASNKYSNDLKIKKNLNNIRGITYNFSQDVKLALKSLFTLEKAIVFFDNDVRNVSHSINITNPYEALKTIDHVILMIVRLFEVKIDLFQSLVEMKTSLLNLKKYRSDITREIRGCQKLASYYELIGAGKNLPSFGISMSLFALLFWLSDRTL